MIGSFHIGMGAAVGYWIARQKTSNILWLWTRRILISAISLASHFILDALPHVDYPLTAPPKAHEILINIADMLCAAFLVYVLYRRFLERRALWIGIFFSVVPDLYWIIKNWAWKPNKIFSFEYLHEGVQSMIYKGYGDTGIDVALWAIILSYASVFIFIAAVPVWLHRHRLRIFAWRAVNFWPELYDGAQSVLQKTKKAWSSLLFLLISNKP